MSMEKPVIRYIIDFENEGRLFLGTVINLNIIPTNIDKVYYENNLTFILRETTAQFFDLFTWDSSLFLDAIKNLPLLSAFSEFEHFALASGTAEYKKALNRLYGFIYKRLIETVGIRPSKNLLLQGVTMDYFIIQEF